MEPLTAGDLARLQRLRQRFLGFESEPHWARTSYWQDERDLALYDQTFAERIGWKWDAVLQELQSRDRTPARGSVLDYGCGTGVASRRWLAAQGTSSEFPMYLWDRDLKAREYAALSTRKQYPGLEVVLALPNRPVDVLLLSHVLDELDESELARVLELARSARSVIWVEPGSRVTSRRLSLIRDDLIATHEILAPCPHASACGVLVPGRESDWCHSFATELPPVATDADWVAFGRAVGVDLRSLPYSFIALERSSGRPGAANARILGRPRLSRGRACLTLCMESGLVDADFLERTDRALFRGWERDRGWEKVGVAELTGTRLTKWSPSAQDPRGNAGESTIPDETG